MDNKNYILVLFERRSGNSKIMKCECGCGGEVTYNKYKPRRFVNGHNRRGIVATEELLRKLSEAHKNISEETRRRMSDARRGMSLSKEARKKLSDMYKGKKRSEEICRKISEAQKGRPSGRLGVHLSEEHRRKIGDAHRGEKHYNWQGGITSINAQIRTSEESKQWRKSVFECDDYICQDCGYRGGKLQPHHIKKFADYPELRFDVDNGITLCKKCHNQIRNHEEEYEKTFENIIILNLVLGENKT